MTVTTTVVLFRSFYYIATLDGNMMADPFEVRMRFTAQLQHLSASVTSSQKAAHYALKYRDLDEDLHSCILEQLERVRVPFCHYIFLNEELELMLSYRII